MKKSEIIQIGKNVLEIEGRALLQLADRMDESFFEAVNLLAAIESRVIVTGIGKSGLVARKIAATLSSCGTPSMFLHPVEAGHGDLGMIVKKDILLVVSYSGNTREISDLLEFAKRIGIRLIGITGNKRSRLAKFSDIVLEAKVDREAEPAGIIPTASTTAALALGDALAIALMRKKGFSERDFAVFHPRGQLGKKLVRISTLMHKGGRIPTVLPDTQMQTVLKEMSEKRLGMTCVVDRDNRLLGIITDGDLRRQLQKHGGSMLDSTAGECLTPDPLVIDREELAAKALNIMEENRVTSLIVTNEKGGLEGIIHLHDLWRTEMF